MSAPIDTQLSAAPTLAKERADDPSLDSRPTNSTVPAKQHTAKDRNSLEKIDSSIEKGLESSSASTSDTPRLPSSYKWLAVFLTALLPLGQTWTEAALGPLKSTLRKELNINNTQYAVIDTAGSIVNSIWPVIGGMCLDWFGVSTVSIICTVTIFIGSIIAALAANTGIWRMLVGGHIMMGFGSAVLDSAQHKLFYHHFGASGLAFAFGLESAFSRTMGLAAGMSTIPIKEQTGWYGWSFWIPVVLCGLSVLANIAYVVWSKHFLPKEARLTGAREIVGNEKKRFSFAAVAYLPWVFWALPLTQIFQSEAASAFSASSTDLIEMKGYTTAVASFTANARRVVPIVLVPILGFCCDRWGRRFHLCVAAALLWVISCAVIGWSDIHPLLPVVIASFASALNAFPFQIVIPLLVKDQTKLGTSFGVWRCFNNSGGVILGIVYGIVQDRTAGMGYSNVLIIGIAFKAFAVFLSLGYIWADHKYLGSGMTMGEAERVRREEEIENPEDDPLTRRTVNKKVTILGLSVLGAMMVAAWVVFIKYVL